MQHIFKNKYFLVVLIIIFSLPVKAGVYYCSEIDSTGFKKSNGKYETVKFKPSKFKAKIDFINGTFSSKDLELNDRSCETLFGYGMSCTESAWTININKDDLKFTLSQAYGFVIGDEDSVSIGYGTCDKF